MRRGVRHCLPIALGIAIAALGLPLPAFAQDTDEDLLGGLQAEIAGRLFDGSLRSQLKRIEDTLTKG